MPVKFLFTPGQEHDVVQGPELIAGVEAETVIADKGNHSQTFVEAIITEGAKPVVPSRSTANKPRRLNTRLYRQRNHVERFINRIKHFRRVATRYEKTTRNFAAVVYCAAAMILLKYMSTQPFIHRRRALLPRHFILLHFFLR